MSTRAYDIGGHYRIETDDPAALDYLRGLPSAANAPAVTGLPAMNAEWAEEHGDAGAFEVSVEAYRHVVTLTED